MTVHSTIALDSERALPIRDHDGLQNALSEANYHTLLMVYVQLSHDEAMLDRFAPFISSPYSMNPVTPPEELQAELRDKLFDLLTQSPAPEVQPLPHALMRKMMSINVAENVDERFLTGSTAKIFSVTAALGEIDPDERFRTPVYAVGRVSGDTLTGDLVLQASGAVRSE